jgi:Uncharacterized protein conserved in bacteria
MNIVDFTRGKYDAFEGKTTIWGAENVRIAISFFDETKGREDEYLAKYLVSINEKLGWIEQNRQKAEKALLDYGMVALAEDWVSGAEEAEDEEQECYVVEDGQKVFLPISNEDFCKSLSLVTIALYFDEETSNAELYLVCKPDYFAGHCVMASVDTENQVKCGSLAG